MENLFLSQEMLEEIKDITGLEVCDRDLKNRRLYNEYKVKLLFPEENTSRYKLTAENDLRNDTLRMYLKEKKIDCKIENNVGTDGIIESITVKHPKKGEYGTRPYGSRWSSMVWGEKPATEPCPDCDGAEIIFNRPESYVDVTYNMAYYCKHCHAPRQDQAAKKEIDDEKLIQKEFEKIRHIFE